MPNLFGVDVYEAERILNECGLQFEIQGGGNIVVSQFPLSEVMVSKNSVVMIELN